MGSAHLNHLIYNEALKVRISPAPHAKHERVGNSQSHKTVIRVVARTRKERKLLAFVVQPFVLTANDISNYRTQHFYYLSASAVIV
jgi:hypothetical protein